MNRKMLIYGLLGIVATAFIVDRVFLSEPAGAKAGTSGTPGKHVDTKRIQAKPDQRTQPDPEHPALSLLSQLTDTLSHRNVFKPSPSMMSYLDQLPQAKSGRSQRSREEEQEKQKEQSRQTFRDAHRLQATAITPGAEMVIVDGKVLRIGEKLDGFTLEKITPYAASFRRDNAVVKLSLPTQP